MGKTTDEVERVEGKWVRRAKAWSIAAGGLATLIVALAAHLKPETVARETAGAAASAIRRVQRELERIDKAMLAAQDSCKRESRRGAARARAEADSARTLLLGYLLAQRGTPQRKIEEAISGVVKQLGSDKAKALQPLVRRAPPRKLDPPVKLEQLSKGGN